MKKTFIAIMLFVNVVKAQVQKGDFNIHAEVGILTSYSFNRYYTNSGLPIGVGLEYAPAKWLVVGAQVGYFNLKTIQFIQRRTSSYGEFGYHYNIDVIYYIGNVKFHWLNKEKFSLYSGVSIGSASALMNAHIDYENYPYPSSAPTYNFSWGAYQATLIGLKYKLGNHFGIHSELGFGIKGLYDVGLDVKF